MPRQSHLKVGDTLTNKNNRSPSIFYNLQMGVFGSSNLFGVFK
ncbi:MAG: hypothetical protein CM15mP102_15610 [Flavobacteriales bacterium]|nr:MAG: hypothetical protein CM15mP102_15610 [Flavobacteriales bacterium]